ncbi:MAG: T9SS type A sorting domain-containing protein [Muribaculaceae bacterium]|nr:T9SS type A sorting domain-containing protein [Muribaculaceae bacterium]
MDLPFSTSERTIRVNTLNGSTIISVKVEANATQVSVPTDALSPGIYLITLTDKGQTSETCKIIVR